MDNTSNRKVRYPHLTGRRDALGLTNDEIAHRIGVKPSWWRALLTGKCVASPEETDRICALLGVDPSTFPHVFRPEHCPPAGDTAAQG